MRAVMLGVMRPVREDRTPSLDDCSGILGSMREGPALTPVIGDYRWSSTTTEVPKRVLPERPRVWVAAARCGTRLEDQMAHAVVMHVKLPQDGSPDDGQRMLEDIVVP